MQAETTAPDLGQLTPALFARFARVAYDNAGIKLRTGKESLVLSRVARRVRALGLPDVAAYAQHLEGDTTGTELVHFIDVISTNVTRFFREPEHFDFLRGMVADNAKRGRKRMRFWSAACSSGEEPYTLAMVLDDVLGKSVDWRILASDLSTTVLARAQRGLYGERAIEPVPTTYRGRYLRKTGDAEDGEAVWAVAPELRERIVFRRVNLAQPPYPMPGPLDAVLCRNVMIYFDDAVRAGVVREAERLLIDGGVLITSHTETLSGLPMKLRPTSPSIYAKGR